MKNKLAHPARLIAFLAGPRATTALAQAPIPADGALERHRIVNIPIRPARGVSSRPGRYLGVPTPRWAAYDKKYFEIDVADDIPMITQEHAYTSPIWCTL